MDTKNGIANIESSKGIFSIGLINLLFYLSLGSRYIVIYTIPPFYSSNSFLPSPLSPKPSLSPTC